MKIYQSYLIHIYMFSIVVMKDKNTSRFTANIVSSGILFFNILSIIALMGILPEFMNSMKVLNLSFLSILFIVYFLLMIITHVFFLNNIKSQLNEFEITNRSKVLWFLYTIISVLIMTFSISGSLVVH